MWFCSDRKISELNGEWREKDSSTDILSFPANDFESPGVFADDPSLEFQKHLGDLVLAPNYIMKQCHLDEEDYKVNMTDIYIIFFIIFYLLFIFSLIILAFHRLVFSLSLEVITTNLYFCMFTNESAFT